VSTAAVVIPNWNGARWIGACLDSVLAQERPPDEVLVVDNGSSDGSDRAAEGRDGVRVLRLGRNTGFSVAVNAGVEAVRADWVALVNTDVVLAEDWLRRACAVLEEEPGVASVATKMVDFDDPTTIYDAGDLLRRDGACEQRGRFMTDDGRFDEPGDAFSACAGAAVYRRDAVIGAGGFDERFFAYLEDVDLGLRLRLAGWRCRYEPAVARHAGEGSSENLDRAPAAWVERNTLLLVAKHFPLRWLPGVAYRQLAWAWHALRKGRLRAHLKGAAAALPALGAMLRERRRLRREAVMPVDAVVPQGPLRGFQLDAAPLHSRPA
jgi:GT2 family glycosyltransferase